MLRERFAFDELEHEERDAIRFFKAVNGGDMRMIERGEELRLALEPADALGIVRERGRQDLQRNVATELRIAGFVDLAHPAGAEGGDDLVGPKSGADRNDHVICVTEAAILFAISNPQSAINNYQSMVWPPQML
jgi:hypothetical protein